MVLSSPIQHPIKQVIYSPFPTEEEQGNFLLLEDGGKLLQENGEGILLEQE